MEENEEKIETERLPSLLISLVPVVFLIAALWLSLVHYSEMELTPHIPLVLATIVAALLQVRRGHTWQDIQEGMVQGISYAIGPILILLVIGLLIGTWIQSGIVPAMIYYGLDLLTPGVFLAATTVICALVSLATGSSWSTAATVGIALMGIGTGLGLSKPIVAGAIISGSYFGDKMSPLSDTTNLAPAVAGAKLFDHIRHMLYTTGPSLIITLIIFVVLGIGENGNAEMTRVTSIHNAIKSAFVMHPALLAPPLLVIAMVVLRIPALPALIGGSFLGALVALWAQHATIGEILQAGYGGMEVTTDDALVNKLLSRGGISSMYSTVALIICALAFGGVMERAKMLESIASGILKLAHGVGGLIAATVFTCLGMNALASDQYLAIVVPGRMYKEAYRKKKLKPVNLSRALEDSATLTSPLIPWNTCGAFMIATLGLEAWTYVPFCFLNLLNPIISVIYGFTGFTITFEDDTKDDAFVASKVADERK